MVLEAKSFLLNCKNHFVTWCMIYHCEYCKYNRHHKLHMNRQGSNTDTRKMSDVCILARTTVPSLTLLSLCLCKGLLCTAYYMYYIVVQVWQTCFQLLCTVCLEQVTAIHPISQQLQLIQISSRNPSVCSSLIPTVLLPPSVCPRLRFKPCT